MKTPLFRSAAIEKHHVKWLGEVILMRPLSFWHLTCAGAILAILTICFFALAQYTKRTTISGELSPDVGVIKVYSYQTGVVQQKLVREGELVRKGAVLYVISSDRQSTVAAGVQASVSRQVALRQQSLREEILHTRKLQRDEDEALRKKIDWLRAEQANIEQQIISQGARLELALGAVKRAEQLFAQGYVSAEMVQQKQAEHLDQRSRFATLERDKIAMTRELQSRLSELESLPVRQRNGIAQLERMIANTDQEWTESEGKRVFSVAAPEDGIVTAAVGEVGQTVDAGRPLTTIIPSRATLEAHLYAPSRAIGFIRPNDRVFLRYQAFPYQKFGHAVGTVASISKVALPNNETAGVLQGTGNGEQVYLVTVNVAKQTINAYGQPHPLQAGMLLEADILQDRRKLYEWVLEPLFSMSGKL